MRLLKEVKSVLVKKAIALLILGHEPKVNENIRDFVERGERELENLVRGREVEVEENVEG